MYDMCMQKQQKKKTIYISEKKNEIKNFRPSKVNFNIHNIHISLSLSITSVTNG